MLIVITSKNRYSSTTLNLRTSGFYILLDYKSFLPNKYPKIILVLRYVFEIKCFEEIK